MNEVTHGKCGCMCHRAGGVLIALGGLVYLLGVMEVLSQHVVHIALPVLVILFGLKKATKGMCKCCSKI